MMVCSFMQRGNRLDPTRGEVVDTEAIASEIVSLKNRISELDEGSVEERDQLLERLRSLQDQLRDRSPEDHAPADAAVQYVKPS